MNNKIKDILLCGFDIIQGRVSVFRINSQITRYQVFSDDYRFPFNAVYSEEDIDIAVDKFLLIVNQIRSTNDKKIKERAKSV
jgi:hypothetical protein